MNRDVLNRILKLAQEDSEHPGELVVPPTEVIAFNISAIRKLMQLKVEALAAMACVSVSTIERVERGEKVSDQVLEKIAVALGEEPGYYTRPRRKQPRDEVHGSMQQIANAVQVRVDPLRTQRQVRELALCQGFLVSRPYLGEDFDEAISGLMEWLDLASYVLTTRLPPEAEREGGRCELYGSVLEAVQAIEQRGVTVLAGVMLDPEPNAHEYNTAVVSITPRKMDPGAIKGRIVFVDPSLSVAHRIRNRKPALCN